MRKTRRKLPLLKETLRALSDLKLARVVGRQEDDVVLLVDVTHGNVCPSP